MLRKTLLISKQSAGASPYPGYTKAVLTPGIIAVAVPLITFGFNGSIGTLDPSLGYSQIQISQDMTTRLYVKIGLTRPVIYNGTTIESGSWSVSSYDIPPGYTEFCSKVQDAFTNKGSIEIYLKNA